MIRINDLYQIDVLKCKSTKDSHIPTKYIIDALGEDDDDHNHAVRISMYEDTAQDLNNQLNEQLVSQMILFILIGYRIKL